jgi:hypothetical protein
MGTVYACSAGHGGGTGTVTLWSPTMSTPLVKMLCHGGPVRAIAIDNSGLYARIPVPPYACVCVEYP